VGNAVWPAALAAWAAEQDLDVAMILTSYASPKKGKRRKQIAALLPRGATDADLATAVFEHFPAEAGSTLGLKAWTEVEVGEVQGVPEGAAVRVWKQVRKRLPGRATELSADADGHVADEEADCAGGGQRPRKGCGAT
jgi:hypothetical protein